MKISHIILGILALALISILGFRLVVASHLIPAEHWTLKVKSGQAGYITDSSGASPWASFYNGNVGIGKANPAEKLDVAGYVRSTGETLNSVNPAIVMQETDVANADYDVQVNSGDFTIFEVNDGRSSFTNRLTLKSGGRVGIGVSAPTQLLDVGGYVKGTGLCIGADCKTAWPAAGGSGTVTSVSAGTGLTGVPNPIITSGSLSVDTSVIQSRVTGTCSVGNSIRAIDANGFVTCQPAGSGTVTSINAGTGIVATPNPITSTGSIAVNTSTIQSRVSGVCPASQAVRQVNADGSVICQLIPPTSNCYQITNCANSATGCPVAVPTQCQSGQACLLVMEDDFSTANSAMVTYIQFTNNKWIAGPMRGASSGAGINGNTGVETIMARGSSVPPAGSIGTLVDDYGSDTSVAQWTIFPAAAPNPVRLTVCPIGS